MIIARNNWGIGQALLHRGVAWAQIGDSRQAIRSYKQAAAFARKRNDKFLLGRILHNFSQCLIPGNPGLAAKILNESIKYKRLSRDKDGLFAVYTAGGILAGHAGKHNEALQFFRRAESLARRSGSRYERAHALHNQAVSLSHLGKSQAAVTKSRQAREIAETLDRKELMILAAQGEASHCYELQDYRATLPLLLKIYDSKKDIGDIQGAIIALSDAAIMELKLKHYDAAKRYSQRAISLSKSTKTHGWLVSCIKNLANIWQAQGKGSESVRLLRREIRLAAGARDWRRVTDLNQILAHSLVTVNASPQTIDEVWLNAIDAAEKQDNILKHLELLRQRYGWILHKQSTAAAILALHPFLELTRRRTTLRRDYVEALDELATCLQKQEKYELAERHYREALNLARRDLNGRIPGSLLNNYAELLRKTGRSAEAIPLYKESLNIDNARGDVDSLLYTEHNLALALHDAGRGRKAMEALVSIQKLARKQRHWEHYTRARLAVADITWWGNRRRIALRRYAEVRSLCDQHHLQGLELHTALNEARLLHELDRNEQALSLLQPLQQRFAESEFCVSLFHALAQCWMNVGKYKEGINVLQRGLQCRDANQGSAAVASLKTSLLEANLHVNRSRISDLEVHQVLSANLSPAERMTRLREILFAVAANEATKPIRGEHMRRLLDEVERLAIEIERPGLMAEIYERLGRILWRKNRRIAGQLYMAGMIKSVENNDPDRTVSIGGDVGTRLHRLGLAKGERSILQMRKQTEVWLRQQLNRNAPTGKKINHIKIPGFLLWPFSFALSILRRPDKGRRITLSEMIFVLQRSLTRGLEPTA